MYRILGQLKPAAATPSTLYTVPSTREVLISSLTVTNVDNANIDYFTIHVVANGDIATDHNKIYSSVEIIPSDSFVATIGVTLNSGDSIQVESTGGYLTFQAFGKDSVQSGTPGAITYFTDLADAPHLYTAQASKLVRVNSSENGLEFIDPGTIMSSSLVQVVHHHDGALFTTSAAIPYDNTIPQSSEGAQWGTLGITPVSATNKLLVQVVLNGVTAYGSNGSDVTAALFKDSDADALAVGHWNSGPMPGGPYGYSQTSTITLNYYMTAGTTSAITFKVRVGAPTIGCVNGNISWTALYAGTFASTITIWEIKA